MTDTLKTRVGRVIAGGMHALVGQLEDRMPEAVMEQAIRDAEAVVDEVRHELGLVSANRHLAQQQHARLNEQHAGLAAQVQQALAADREELARAAVARQLDIEDQIPVLENTLSEYARQEAELKGYVAALAARRREMAEALDLFRKSRAAVTAPGPATAGQAQQRIDSAAQAFDRVFQRHTGLSGTDRSTSADQAARLRELDELVRSNKITERMAQLKA